MKLYGVTIYLASNFSIDVSDILNVFAEIGSNLNWKISNIDCLGRNSEILHHFSDNSSNIDWLELNNLFSGIYQTLEGEIEGTSKEQIKPSIKIREIRGDEFDIETENVELLNKIRSVFPNVKDLVY